MPKNCFIPGCTGRSSKDNIMSFYLILTNSEVKNKLLESI